MVEDDMDGIILICELYSFWWKMQCLQVIKLIIGNVWKRYSNTGLYKNMSSVLLRCVSMMNEILTRETILFNFDKAFNSFGNPINHIALCFFLSIPHASDFWHTFDILLTVLLIVTLGRFCICGMGQDTSRCSS